jgi:hypothetical protein
MKKDDLKFTDKGFDRGAFMQYMEKSFNLTDFGFTRELIGNVLSYAEEHEHVSKDMFAYFVADIIPEIDFREVCGFCEDSILTSNGIYEKNRFWEEKAALLKEM